MNRKMNGSNKYVLKSVLFILCIAALFLFKANLYAEDRTYEINYDLNQDGHISSAIVGNVMYIKGDGVSGIDKAPGDTYQGIETLYIEDGVVDIEEKAFENTPIKKVYIEPYINPGNCFLGSNVEELLLSWNYEGVPLDSWNPEGSNKLKVFLADPSMNPNGTVYATEIKNVLYIAGSGTIKKSGLYQFGSVKEAYIEEGITGIGDYAFEYSQIEKIHIPDTVTSIGKGAFADSHLKEIKLPNSVKTIGSLAFCSPYIKKVELPKNIKHVNGFQGCRIERIVLPNGVESLEQGLFMSSYTKYIEIPGTVKILPYQIFATSKVEELVLHEGIEVLGTGALADCVHLRHLKLPESLKEIGKNAFSCCNNLEELIVPGNVKVVDAAALDSCYSIKKLVLCEGVEELKNKVCDNCEHLETLVLPSTLLKVGKDCFKDCNELKYVYIPENVRTIADYAFGFSESMPNAASLSSASTLMTIDSDEAIPIESEAYGGRWKIPGFVIGGKAGTTAEKYARKYGFTFISDPNYKKRFTKNKLKYIVTGNREARCYGASKQKSSVIIPDKVTFNKRTYKVTGIAKNAFKGNKKLSKLTIGKYCKYIGERAFYNCSRLKTIIIKSKNIKKSTVKKNAFKGTHKYAKVTVHKKKKKTYRSILLKKGISKKAKFIAK